MDKTALSALKKWYSQYACSFLQDDPDLAASSRLKINHTARVRLHVMRLAEELTLAEQDRRRMEAVALLHDVGRFEQFARYRTFDDRISADHADIGLGVIERQGCLDSLSETDRKLIRAAVSFHNKLHLPETTDDALLLMVKMIRDADKLDIFDIILKDHEKDPSRQNTIINLGLPDTDAYQNRYLTTLWENRIADNRNVKTLNDLRLVRLSWIFDLNFRYSANYTLKILYIERIISHLPRTVEIGKTKEHLLEFLRSRNTGP